MVPLARWMGLDPSDPARTDYVFPNLKKFNDTHIISASQLFKSARAPLGLGCDRSAFRALVPLRPAAQRIFVCLTGREGGRHNSHRAVTPSLPRDWHRTQVPAVRPHAHTTCRRKFQLSRCSHDRARSCSEGAAMLQHSQPSKEKKVIVEFVNPEALKLKTSKLKP